MCKQLDRDPRCKQGHARSRGFCFLSQCVFSLPQASILLIFTRPRTPVLVPVRQPGSLGRQSCLPWDGLIASGSYGCQTISPPPKPTSTSTTDWGFSRLTPTWPPTGNTPTKPVGSDEDLTWHKKAASLVSHVTQAWTSQLDNGSTSNIVWWLLDNGYTFIPAGNGNSDLRFSFH